MELKVGTVTRIFKLPAALDNLLVQRVRDEGVTLSEFMRRLITKELQQPGSLPFDPKLAAPKRRF